MQRIIKTDILWATISNRKTETEYRRTLYLTEHSSCVFGLGPKG